MDRDFTSKIEQVNKKGKILFSVNRNTFFSRSGDRLTVRYVADSGESVEHSLKTIEELVEGDRSYDPSDDQWTTDTYLPLLMAIESAIKRVYQENPGLKDKAVIAVLERLIMKLDIRLMDELSTTIQNYIRLILSANIYSRKEVVGCLKKVQKSVKRHHRVDGPTGYLDFIEEHM